MRIIVPQCAKSQCEVHDEEEIVLVIGQFKWVVEKQRVLVEHATLNWRIVPKRKKDNAMYNNFTPTCTSIAQVKNMYKTTNTMGRLSFETITCPPKKKTQTYARVLIAKSKDDEDTHWEVGHGYQEEPQPKMIQVYYKEET